MEQEGPRVSEEAKVSSSGAGGLQVEVVGLHRQPTHLRGSTITKRETRSKRSCSCTQWGVKTAFRYGDMHGDGKETPKDKPQWMRGLRDEQPLCT